MPGPALLRISAIVGQTQLAINGTHDTECLGDFSADANGLICSIGSGPNETIRIQEKQISLKQLTIRQNQSGILILRDWSADGTTVLFQNLEENTRAWIVVPVDPSRQIREVVLFQRPDDTAHRIIIRHETRCLQFELELLGSLDNHFGVQVKPFDPDFFSPKKPTLFDPFLPMKRNNWELERTGKGKRLSMQVAGDAKRVESSEIRQAYRSLDKYVGGFFIQSIISIPDEYHQALPVEDVKHFRQLCEFERLYWYFQNHPNILPFYGIKQVNQNQLHLLEGDHSGTALYKAEQQPGQRLSRQLEWSCLKQMLTVLEYLHLFGVQHSSISPENIVILDLSNGDLDPRAVIFKLGCGANARFRRIAMHDEKYLAQSGGRDIRALFVTLGILMDLDLRELWKNGETGPRFNAAFVAAVKSKMPELADMVLGDKEVSASEYLQLMKDQDFRPKH